MNCRGRFAAGLGLLAGLAAGAGQAAAQTAWRPGVRLRVTTPARRLTGRLLSLSGDSLRLDPGLGRPPATLSFGQLERLEVSDGRRAFVGRGAVRGAVLGAAVGAAAGGVACLNGPCKSIGGRAVATSIAGAVGGAFVGAVFRREHWRAVPLGDLPASLPARDSVLGSIAVSRHGHGGTGLLIGAVVGGLAGAALATGDGLESSGFDARPLVVVAGVLVGGVVGLVVGSAVRTGSHAAGGMAVEPLVGAGTGGLTVGARIFASPFAARP